MRDHRRSTTWAALVGLLVSLVVVVGADVATAPTASATSLVWGGLSTLAGSGTTGQADGTGSSASFDTLVDLAADSTGANVFALEWGTSGRPNQIRKINTSTGAVSTFASGGMLSGTTPTHLRVDPQGRVWVATKVSWSEKAIIRYPAAGGTPSTVVNGIGGLTIDPQLSSGAFAFDATDLYFTAAEAGVDSGISDLRKIPLSSLEGAPVAASSSTWLGGIGDVFRNVLLDARFAPDGNLYVIWDHTGPGGVAAYPPQLYKYDLASHAFTLVASADATGGFFAQQRRIVFSPVNHSAYLPCTQDTPGFGLDNGCRGQGLLIRRAEYGAGAAETVAGGVWGFADGSPGKMGADAVTPTATGLVMSPDGTKIWLADAANHRIRTALPPQVLYAGKRGIGEWGSPSQSCAQCSVTHWPVAMPWGAFYHSFAGISMSGRLPLSFSTTYRSNLAGTDSGLGLGWTGSYGMSLTFDGNGAATVNEEGGSAVSFVPRPGGGGYDPQAPRTIATFVDNGNGTYTFTRRATDRFTFEARPGSGYRLKTVADANGNHVDLAYAATSPYQLTTATDSASPSRSLTFTWVGGHITQVADSAGRTIGFGYTGSLMTSHTTLTGGVWTFGYEAGSNRMLTMLDPAQQSLPSGKVPVTNHYDASGRVDYQDDQNGHRTLFDYTSYDPATGAGTVLVTDPVGHVEAQAYNDNVPVAITKGYGSAIAATWSYQYDAYTGQPTRTTDPNGHSSQATYDHTDGHMGNPLSTTDALGRTTSYTYLEPGTGTYSPYNLPYTVTDAIGTTTTLTYDASNLGPNLVSRSTPLTGSSPPVAQTVSYAHADGAHPGDVTSMVDERGKTWSFHYDGAGLQDQVTNPMAPAETTITCRDSVGRLKAIVQPLATAASTTCATVPALPASPPAHVTSFQTDSLGHVTLAKDSFGHQTSTQLDPNDNLWRSTDGDGNLTTYLRDKAWQVIQVNRADGSQVKTTYWDDGTVRDQIDGANHTIASYAYDAQGRLSTATYDDGSTRTTTYQYDLAGNLTRKIDPGGACPGTSCTQYGYDAADQLKTVDYGDTTPDITDSTYDGDGRVLARVAANGTSTWAYDSLGRLTSTADASGAVTYLYADLGAMPTTLRYPGNHDVTRHYDNAGRYDSSTDWNGKVTSFSYDKDSNQTGITFPSATTNSDVFTFDEADRLMGVTMKKGAATLASLTYSRTNGDLLSQEVQTGLPGAATTSFGYDCLDRLRWSKAAAASAACNASVPSGATVFGYDPSDNLTTGTAGTQTFANASSNQITASGSTTFGFDGRGNRTSMTPSGQAPTAYGYDLANRLTSYWPSSASGNDGDYVALTPARIMDTRPASRTGDCGGGAASCTTFTSAATKDLQVTGAGGVPAVTDVDSVMVTLSAVGSTGSAGWLRAWTQGATAPNTSNLNFNAGQLISNAAIVKVSATGKISLADVGWVSGSTADFTVDVLGYYTKPASGVAAEFTAINPIRQLDTRTPNTPPSQCTPTACTSFPAGGGTQTMRVAGLNGVPSGVTSVAVNVTAIAGTAPGYLTLYQGNTSPRPVTSNLIFAANQTVADFAVVPVDANGYINVYSNAQTNVIVDVEGYNAAASSSGSRYTENPTPTRLLDSRSPTSPCTANPCTSLGSGATTKIQVVGGKNQDGTTSLVPAGASAVAVNLTAIPSTGAGGYLTIYAGDAAQPSTSNLQFGTTPVAISAIVKLGADGSLKLTNSVGNNLVTHYAVDVVGWYTDQWLYAYNADGLRTAKTAPDGTQTTFTWEKSGGLPMLVSETTAGGSTYYLYGPGGLPYAQIAPDGTTTYLHHDQLGSTRAITDAAGNIAGSTTYNPYGTLNSTGTGAARSRFGFAGQYTDQESGLQYLRARYYEPTTGQFLTRDPIAAETRDSYGYAGRSPIVTSDPSGLDPARCDMSGCRGGISSAGSAAPLDPGPTNPNCDLNNPEHPPSASMGLLCQPTTPSSASPPNIGGFVGAVAGTVVGYAAGDICVVIVTEPTGGTATVVCMVIGAKAYDVVVKQVPWAVDQVGDCGNAFVEFFGGIGM